MTPYTRAAFADWLRTLPPDEPFCGEGKCPIAASPFDLLDEKFPNLRNYAACDTDTYLVGRIDAAARSPLTDIVSWRAMTPRQILLIIDELEAASDNRS